VTEAGVEALFIDFFGHYAFGITHPFDITAAFGPKSRRPAVTYDQLGYELDARYKGDGTIRHRENSSPMTTPSPMHPTESPSFDRSALADEPGFYPDEAPSDEGVQDNADED